MKKAIRVIIILVGLIGLCVFIYVRYEKHYRERWTSRTSPLHASTITDLCKRLELDANEKLCRLEKDVYAGDFYPIIKDKIQPKDQEWMDYDQINELLGAYIWDECYVNPGEKGTISCTYDLRGYGAATISTWFTPDGELTNLFMHVLKD